MPEASAETAPEEADQPVRLRLVQPPLEVEGGVVGGAEFELTGSSAAIAASLAEAPIRAALENLQRLFASNLRNTLGRGHVEEGPTALPGHYVGRGLLITEAGMGSGKTETFLALMREVEEAGEDPAEFIASATRDALKRRAMERWLDEQDEDDEPITEEEIQAARARYRRA